MPGIRRTLLLLSLVLIPAARSAAEPNVEDLRRGLVATYRDASPTEVQRLEPTIALALKAGESPHPRLDGKTGTATWKGYVNVVRGGAYRFRVRLRGEFRLSVGGKEVLKVKETGDAPT